MKKIGILTFHRSINYGAFLQAYSLATKIKESTNNKVEIIDYQKLDKYRNYQKHILISTDISLLGPYRNYKMYNAFKKSLKILPLSSEPIITNDDNVLRKAIEGKYDILITGSDAVFNFAKDKLPNPYWLSGFNNIDKMSYAASAHGMDFDKIDDHDYNTINNLLSDFSYIGARDEETIKMIKKSNNKYKVYRNCDPTVFLDLSKYKTDIDHIIYNKYGIPKNKKIIGLMVYDKELGKRIKNKYGKDYFIVSIYRNNPYADCYLYDLNPFEWSHFFSRIELLFTKYFHGTLLSLKNTTPTITIDYSKNVEKYNTKLKDLLCRLNLDECYFIKEKLIDDNNYDLMFETADSFLRNSNDIKHKIVTALNEEIKHSDSFFQFLAK